MTYMCYECEREFGSRHALSQHCDALDHVEARECRYCNLIFPDDDELDDHLREEHDPLQCNSCGDGRIFYGQDALDQHNAAKHSHQCNSCNRAFATPEALRSHSSAAHNLTCTQCGQFYRHKTQFDKHLASPFHAEAIRLHNSTNLECCGRIFADQTALYQHRLTALTHVETQDGAPQVIAECSTCDMTFVNHRALNQHLAMSSVHQNHDYNTRDLRPEYPEGPSRLHIQGHSRSIPYQPQPFKCRHCEVSFRAQDILNTHSEIMHRTQSLKPGEKLSTLRVQAEEGTQVMASTAPKQPIQNSLFDCDKCSGKFNTMALLQEHEGKWHSFRCGGCFGVTFDDAVALQRHREERHYFKCPKCRENVFLNLEALLKHHSSSHEIQCLKCEKKCESLPDLLQHWQSHLWECTWCTNKFETSLSLDHHVTLEHPERANPEQNQSFKSTQRFTSLQPNARNQRSTETQTSDSDDSFFSVSTSNDPPASSPQSSAPSQELNPKSPRRRQSDGSTQTTVHRCDECIEIFDTEAELQSHLKNSPFHGAQPIQCYECSLKFRTPLDFLIHHESKPHQTRCVLSVI